jgi:hypothetical protein
LIERLQAYVETGEVTRIYEKNFKKAKAKKEVPQKPLLYVPSHTGRVLKIDLEAAGIPINTPKGKLGFHACRVAFINPKGSCAEGVVGLPILPTLFFHDLVGAR